MRASSFVGVGLIVGLIVGASSVAAYGALTAARRAPSDTGQPTATAVPGPNTGRGPASAPSTARLGNPAVSALAGSSLQQAAVVNVKLAEAEAALRSALAQQDFDPAATADILRSIAANASFGSELAPNIAGWQPAEGLSAELIGFYESLRATAREGLEGSITSSSAYKQAARAMLSALEPLDALDREARQLAATADIELPKLP